MYMGHYPQAYVHGQTALNIAQKSQQHRALGYANLLMGGIALGRAELDRAQAYLDDSLCAYGGRGQALQTAVAYCFRGYTRCLLGQFERARQDLTQALQIGRKTSNVPALLYGVTGIALLEACQANELDADEAERVVGLHAMGMQSPMLANSRFHEDVIGQHVMTAAANLSPEAVAAAQTRGRARDLDATVADWLEKAETDVRS
jgi:hypothetical protein